MYANLQGTNVVVNRRPHYDHPPRVKRNPTDASKVCWISSTPIERFSRAKQNKSIHSETTAFRLPSLQGSALWLCETSISRQEILSLRWKTPVSSHGHRYIQAGKRLVS